MKKILLAVTAFAVIAASFGVASAQEPEEKVLKFKPEPSSSIELSVDYECDTYVVFADVDLLFEDSELEYIVQVDDGSLFPIDEDTDDLVVQSGALPATHSVEVILTSLDPTQEGEVRVIRAEDDILVNAEDTCPTPTPTATTVPTATSTPSPTATSIPTVQPLDLCTDIEGVQTSVPDGLEWNDFTCTIPEVEDPEPDVIIVEVPRGTITPPNTGDAGLLQRFWSGPKFFPFWGGGGGANCTTLQWWNYTGGISVNGTRCR